MACSTRLLAARRAASAAVAAAPSATLRPETCCSACDVQLQCAEHAQGLVCMQFCWRSRRTRAATAPPLTCTSASSLHGYSYLSLLRQRLPQPQLPAGSVRPGQDASQAQPAGCDHAAPLSGVRGPEAPAAAREAAGPHAGASAGQVRPGSVADQLAATRAEVQVRDMLQHGCFRFETTPSPNSTPRPEASETHIACTAVWAGGAA